MVSTGATLNEPRVLDAAPVPSLAAWLEQGGRVGLDAAKQLGPEGTIEHVTAAGLRGRGGGGFPTGRKWQAIADHAAGVAPATVVVNGAEGEPGSFKDRAILRTNPYRVLEGALIAAQAVNADRVIVALKASFGQELARLQAAVAELGEADWLDGVSVEVVTGPGEYLFGEETGLLEVLAGRAPLPRLAPPYRHGADELGEGGASPASVTMADDQGATAAPPTLVNNVETLANVPGILSEGPDWYRSLGTAESPGTIVCTISGDTERDGVGEVAMGTPLRAAIEQIAGGPSGGEEIAAVLSGVANPLLPATLLDTPITYEDMEAAGAGLGAAGFIVFDSRRDLVAVVQGVARFLAVESCGQCQPCKQDGLALADLLDRVRLSDVGDHEIRSLGSHVESVAVGARCFLAHQQERVVGGLLERHGEAIEAHRTGRAAPGEPVVVAPIADLVDGVARLDPDWSAKQPDWTFDETYSGQSPAERIDQESVRRSGGAQK